MVELVFSNAAMGHLVIQKYDSATKLPLAGVTFRVTDSSGAVIWPNNGLYTTDATGVITIKENLPIGSTVIVTEVSGPDTHNLDAPAQAVKIKENTTYTLVFYNTPKSGLVITKLDEETRRPIAGAEFSITKMNGARISANNYTTDKNGVIRVNGLEDGWYTITETKATDGYILDATPRNVEVKDGTATPITITNRKQSGILLHKTDAVTGKGIYGVKFLISDGNGNPLRTETTDQSGYLYTTGLVDGKYLIQEIEAAPGYYLDSQIKTFYIHYGSTATIKWTNTPQMGQIQIIKKSGDDNEVSGLPAGTLLAGAIFEAYNQSLKYKVLITTNKGDTRIIADNLSTTKNNVIDCSNASLGLYNDEYVTSVTLVFGTVKAGFAQVEQPQVYVKVLSTLQNGYQFANKADVGGKYGDEWVVGNTTWVTTIYKKATPLPRTGF